MYALNNGLNRRTTPLGLRAYTAEEKPILKHDFIIHKEVISVSVTG